MSVNYSLNSLISNGKKKKIRWRGPAIKLTSVISCVAPSEENESRIKKKKRSRGAS